MNKSCYKNRSLIALLIVVAFAMVFFFVTTSAVFAADSSSLELESSLPVQGSSNLQSQNVGIKLYFNGDVTADTVKEANARCFKFTYESEGATKELPVKAYSDANFNKEYILAIIDTNQLKGNILANDADYKLIISGDLVSADGKTLGVNKVLDFRTVDQSGSTKIYMLLMAAMVGAMIVMTVFQNKRKQTAAAEVAAKGGKVNPYKLAKDKKIPVKEAMELIERDRQRRLKRLGIAEGKDERAAEAAATKPRNTKKVKGPKPISEAGSSYKTGRAVIAERRATEALKKYEQTKSAKSGAKASKPKPKGRSNKSNKKKGKRR